MMAFVSVLAVLALHVSSHSYVAWLVEMWFPRELSFFCVPQLELD